MVNDNLLNSRILFLEKDFIYLQLFRWVSIHSGEEPGSLLSYCSLSSPSLKLKSPACISSTRVKMDREPLRHRSVAFMARNDSLVRRYCITSSYRSPLDLLILTASALWYKSFSCPITPVVVKINGVKVPCSMFMIL